MIYILIIICLFFLVAGLTCSKNNLFSPSVITSAVWITCFIFFIVLDHNLPPLSLNFFIAVGIWITGISMSSLVAQSLTYRNQELNDPGRLMLNIYLILSIISFPTILEFAKIAIVNGSYGNWAMNLRMAALGKGSGFEEPFGGFQMVIWQVSLLLELLCFDKKKWWRLAIISFIYISFGFFTMSKIIFLNFFFFSCSILYFKNKIRLKHLVIGISVLLVLFLGLQSVRHAIKFSNASDNFFVVYLIGNMSSFDTLTPCTAEHWGENTFRLFYAITNKLGISDIEPVDTILKWIDTPINTNTYTGMYPFYIDFGLWGIGIFSVLLGWIYGWIFKKAQMGNNFYILLYAVTINIIFTQYVADMLFTNFAGYFKLLILLALPFIITKYNLLAIRQKFGI